MTDQQIQLWAWLCRQGPKTIESIFEKSKVDPQLFFKTVGSMKHRKDKTASRKLMVAKPLDELSRVHELRFDRMKKVKKKKRAKKARAIERQYFVIKNLRDKGASWTDIISYLKRYHKLDVTRQYLGMIVAELDQKYAEKE